MATKKISEFTTLGSLSDTDILPVVNAGSNKKITGATLKTYAQSGLTIPTDVSDLTDTTSLLGGGSGTLDSVTDSGSTTTNGITVGSLTLTDGHTIGTGEGSLGITSPLAVAIIADSGDTNQLWLFGTDGTLTFPNGDLKIAGNTISNYVVGDPGSSGSQLEVAPTKTVITNGVINSLGEGGPSLTSQALFEVGTNGILSSFQVINSLGEGETTLTSEYLTELDNNSFKIGQRTTNDLGDGSEPLVAFNGWTFGTDGALTFPTLTVPISDNATPSGTGQTIKFSDSSQQAIIFGPEALSSGSPSAQRVIIQGAPGYTGTAGEGGDVYLWAGPGGSVDGNGGDIKVRGGYGNGTGGGGYLNFQAGDSGTGNGGYINIESGQSGTQGLGGDIDIRARSGGDIDIRAHDGGEITLSTDTVGGNQHNWQFGNNGSLTLPSGGIITDNVETVTITGAGTSEVNQTYGKASNEVYVGQTDNAYQIDPPYAPDFNYKLRINTEAGGYYESEDLITWTIVAGAGGGTAPVPTGVILPQRITVTVDSSSWTFGTDGALTLPLGGTIADGSSGSGVGHAIILKPQGGSATQALKIYPTATGDGDHVHLTAGQIGGTTELYLGDDFQYVKLVNDGNVQVRASTWAGSAGSAAWTFGTDGAISTTDPLIIKVPNGIPTGVGAIASTTSSWEQNPATNLATTGGSGTGLRVSVTHTGGYASAIAITVAGTGYLDGELITVTSGGSMASFIIAVTGTINWTFGTDGSLTFPRDAVTNTDPYLTIVGGANPTILSSDASLAGPANLAMSVDYLNISGSNGKKIVAYPDQGLLGADANMVLITNFADQANNSAWTFGTDGNVTIPGNIIGAATIAIDNRDSGTSAAIQLYSADDILIQARDRAIGSTAEGGDINIFAGDSAEDSDTSAGDIVIEAGNGGASNIDYGGSGGFVRVEAGQGGAASTGVGDYGARPGGALTLRAGDGGTNNGNIDRGAAGGNVIIEAGDSTGNGVNGGTIYLTSGGADASALAGNVVIQAGGTWTFDGAGNLTLPSAGKIVNNSNEWTFDTGGDLTAPGNIILNNPVTTVTTSVTGTVADSNGNPFTFRILKADNPQLITPFADPNFVLKWTGTDAGSVAAGTQAPGGQGPSSLVSDDGTYWNFNSWFGLNSSRPNTGTVFTVEYGVVVSDTMISTTETNLVIEADAKQYKFGTDGNLTLPAGGSIVDSAGANVFVSLATLKQVVAASTDFADFQSRISGML